MSDTKHDKELGPLFLRIGIALTLIFSLVTKFGNTEKVVGMMGKLGLNFASSPGVVTALGIILLISAALLLFGLFTRQNAIFLTVFFAVTVLTGISAGILSAGPAIWKDFGLLGGALALVLLGAGSYSIDKKRS